MVPVFWCRTLYPQILSLDFGDPSLGVWEPQTLTQSLHQEERYFCTWTGLWCRDLKVYLRGFLASSMPLAVLLHWAELVPWREVNEQHYLSHFSFFVVVLVQSPSWMCAFAFLVLLNFCLTLVCLYCSWGFCCSHYGTQRISAELQHFPAHSPSFPFLSHPLCSLWVVLIPISFGVFIPFHFHFSLLALLFPAS